MTNFTIIASEKSLYFAITIVFGFVATCQEWALTVCSFACIGVDLGEPANAPGTPGAMMFEFSESESFHKYLDCYQLRGSSSG